MVVMMSGYGGGGWPVWAIALMWVGMAVLLGVLIWGGYALITGAARTPGRKRRDQDTRGALDARLASGQIDTAEYQRLSDLIAAGGALPGTGSRP
jgi:uncharacterized membrane protein